MGQRIITVLHGLRMKLKLALVGGQMEAIQHSLWILYLATLSLKELFIGLVGCQKKKRILIAFLQHLRRVVGKNVKMAA